ncbi:MAG: DUF4249 domain-containing protein [Bacteroidales bacterium]|nr:DUF4249 domain-containing protein [Bacteroidales bacterium]
MIFLAITVVTIAACQEEIDIKLNDASPKVVVEAELTDTLPPYTIRLSHTIDFSEPNAFAAITDANIVLSDDMGNSETLVQDSAGFYGAKTIIAMPEHIYTLSIKTDGEKTYTATCKMPSAVEIDTLVMTTYSYGSISVRMTEVKFTDKAGEKGFYRIKYYVNGKLRSANLANDEGFDGKQISVSIFGDNPYNEAEQLHIGDSIRIELYTITEDIYSYFRSLRNTSSASPANPKSNIRDALGYFNVCTMRWKEIIIE